MRYSLFFLHCRKMEAETTNGKWIKWLSCNDNILLIHYQSFQRPFFTTYDDIFTITISYTGSQISVLTHFAPAMVKIWCACFYDNFLENTLKMSGRIVFEWHLRQLLFWPHKCKWRFLLCFSWHSTQLFRISSNATYNESIHQLLMQAIFDDNDIIWYTH